MKKLIIFDLDGTLLDTLSDLANAVNYALQKHGYQPNTLDAYRYFVGNGVRKLVERALPENAREEDIINRVFDTFIDYYGKNKAVMTKPYPGICELLSEIRHQGIILAVASNKYHEGTCELINTYFEPETFDIVYGHRPNIPIKPAPDVVFAILNEANIDIADALYVGDSQVDMCTAKAAGIESIGVTWGFRTKQELLDNGAAHIVDNPHDILSYIR